MKRFASFRHGFTLMELLVVLLIVGVLSTVAIRTIDATRNRAFFDQTAAEMKGLVKAIVGDPELVTDGRRLDFGFYGDVGRLPSDLRELVENVNSDSRWHGPYVRREFAADSVGYLHDAWGHPFTYDRTSGIITSLGDGVHPMTVRVADSLGQLSDNAVVGTAVDAENNPPGVVPVYLGLYTPDGDFLASRVADRGGYYEFSPRTGTPIGIGMYRLVAQYGLGNTDTIARWVTVPPRSRVVVDFRFGRPFRNLIKMVGTPQLYTDTSGFTASVVNDDVYPIEIQSIDLIEAPDSAYLRDVKIDGTSWPGFPLPSTPPTNGYGKGSTIPLLGGTTIPADRSHIVTFGFYDFYQDSLGPPSPKANLASGTFRLRFSDGSEVTFTLPSTP